MTFRSFDFGFVLLFDDYFFDRTWEIQLYMLWSFSFIVAILIMIMDFSLVSFVLSESLLLQTLFGENEILIVLFFL
jgi:hypothetical protein